MTAFSSKNGRNLEILNSDDREDSVWRRALQEGLEADHSCEAMLNNFQLSAHPNNEGFDIILNPSNKKTTHHNDGIEIKTLECEQEHLCSASNTHCVASLAMALSTHPLVLSIESEDQIIADDYESQWITQTKREGKVPLKDILGLNGKNQIISIIDSGLDINHKYFGPTNKKVFNVSNRTVTNNFII